ncbi:class I SAM-dependent methyltransferase [Pseudomonas putida]
MTNVNAPTKNWFEQGAQAYARFRPEYPKALAAYLAAMAPSTAVAIDVGCGNGQLTKQLAEYFNSVTGFDPSEDQILHADGPANVSYRCASAEDLPLLSRSADLITAAQAAHWFDLPRFYAEVRRVATPGAILALISYGVLNLDADINERFEQFYWHDIGAFWPEERKLVDSGYATLDFPFAEITGHSIQIKLQWSLEEFLGYISTWSAVRRAKESGQEAVLQRFAADLATLWGEAQARRTITWPINMRVARL